MSQPTPEIDPDALFKLIKDSKVLQSIPDIDALFVTTMEKLEGAKKAGQTTLISRLTFIVRSLIGEQKAVEAGFDQYVNKGVIIKYIDSVKGRPVKLIELDRYPRPIPKECIEKIAAARKLKVFDKFHVVFTDYTGAVTKKIEQEERKKDPIVFGAFDCSEFTIERLYFICDWEDEYCDLTLSKLLSECTKKKIDMGPTHAADLTKSLKELKAEAVKFIDEEEMKKRKAVSLFTRLKNFFARNPDGSKPNRPIR